jgi:hypothetical protein
MIIHVSADGRRELLEADDFKKFKVVVEKSQDRPGLEKALAEIATLTADADHAWVSPDALVRHHGQGRDDAWRAAFDAMVEGARKYGFVDAGTGAVRAHVEVAAS